MGEVTVSARGKELAIVVPEKDSAELGLSPGAGYELVKAGKGIWVLVAREKPAQKDNPLDAGIMKLLGEKDLKERVEGRFERFLGKEELARFKEMLKEGTVVAFKLSPKYRKAVYKTREEIEKKRGNSKGPKESESDSAKERPFEEYSIEKDGFIVCKDEHKAKALSEELKSEIEEGRIRGIKSFDGFFYIAEEGLYQKYRQNALSLIQAEKGIGAEKLAEKLGVSLLLAKIVCELLKDEGEIIEKRKNQFQAI